MERRARPATAPAARARNKDMMLHRRIAGAGGRRWSAQTLPARPWQTSRSVGHRCCSSPPCSSAGEGSARRSRRPHRRASGRASLVVPPLFSGRMDGEAPRSGDRVGSGGPAGSTSARRRTSRRCRAGHARCGAPRVRVELVEHRADQRGLADVVGNADPLASAASAIAWRPVTEADRGRVQSHGQDSTHGPMGTASRAASEEA